MEWFLSIWICYNAALTSPQEEEQIPSWYQANAVWMSASFQRRESSRGGSLWWRLSQSPAHDRMVSTVRWDVKMELFPCNWVSEDTKLSLCCHLQWHILIRCPFSFGDQNLNPNLGLVNECSSLILVSEPITKALKCLLRRLNALQPRLEGGRNGGGVAFHAAAMFFSFFLLLPTSPLSLGCYQALSCPFILSPPAWKEVAAGLRQLLLHVFSWQEAKNKELGTRSCTDS